MRISPISFGTGSSNRMNVSNDYIPTIERHNSLSDMDFNIIADTLRCQNLKSQMSTRLFNLKRSLNSCMAQDLYKEQ